MNSSKHGQSSVAVFIRETSKTQQWIHFSTFGSCSGVGVKAPGVRTCMWTEEREGETEQEGSQGS